MKWICKGKGLSLTLAAAFIAYAITLLGAVTVPAEAQRQFGAFCNDCHEMPPVDSAYRNISTGGFKGNHTTHNPPSVAPKVVCEKCHSGSAGYFTDHSNGFINMTSNINNSSHPSRATYNKPRFFNQTSNPVMQTCSNINCHFETVTPTWGSAPFNDSADCSACHTVPGSSSSHARHDAYFPFTSNGCIKCHHDYKTGLKFSHATSAGHAGRGIKVVPGEGSYSGTGLNFLPSQSVSRTFGSCSNVYCHGNYPGGKNASPEWGNAASGACGTCHGASDSAVPGNTGPYNGSGSHYPHASQNAKMKYLCTTCHAATVSGTLNNYSTNKSNHVNGFADVKFDPAGSQTSFSPSASYSIAAGTVSPSSGTPRQYGTCRVYCHSNVQGNGGIGEPSVYAGPKWGGSLPSNLPANFAWRQNCDACHYSVWHPEASQIDNGSHSKHVTFLRPAFDWTDSNGMIHGYFQYCAVCHVNFKKNSSANPWNCNLCHGSGTDLSHKNGIIDVGFDTGSGSSKLTQGVGAAYNDQYGGRPGTGFSTCTNMSCHSDGTTLFTGTVPDNATPLWGTNANLGCNSCHGYPPEYANGSPKPNSHAEHLAFSCDKCHYKVTSDGINIISGAKYHARNETYYVDPNVGSGVTFTYSRVYEGGKYSGTCSNISCHSNGSATWGTTLSPILPSGAVAYWKLDETTGTTANDSIGTNNGAISGATRTAGKVNNGLSFNGSDNFVSVPDNSALNPSGDQTIEFWIKFSSLPSGARDIIQKGLGTGDTQFYIRTNDSDGMDFASCNTARCYNLSRSYADLGISAGSWYHIAFTVNDSTTQTAAVYINGAQKASASGTSTTRTANSAALTIGGSADGYFSGLLDEVIIYNSEVTAEWVKSRYYAGDTALPSVTAFAASDSTSLTIPISVFTAADDIQITGYMITTTPDKPLSTASGWTSTAPASYTVSADGTYTIYPWVKDGAGKVSALFASPPAAIADTSIPTVTSTVPADGATSPANGTITITWSENMDCATINTANVTINAGGLTLLGCSNNHAVFSTSGQTASATYTVTISSAITDAAGNHIPGDYVFFYAATTPDILSLGAVAYWKLDEGQGQTAADSVGPRTGTVGATPAPDANDPAWTTQGHAGNALSFDGADKYLIADGSSALNAANLTLDAWVSAQAYTGSNARGTNNFIVLSRQQAGGRAGSGTPVNGYELGLTSEGYPYFTFEDISVNLWAKSSTTTPPTADSGIPSTLGRVPHGSSGKGDDGGVFTPTVIKDGSLYKMWYAGGHYAGNDTTNYRIFYATSPDGINWTKLDNSISDPLDGGQASTNGRVPLGSSNRADSGTLRSPAVIKDGSVYKMWYATNYAVLYAESPDGLAWTKYDNSYIQGTCDSYVTHDQACRPWTKGQLVRGSSGRGDSIINSVSVIKDGQTYKMWYVAAKAGGSSGIYYATSPDGLTWTKYDNTVPAPSDTTGTNGRIPIGINGGDSSTISNVKVIKDGSVYKMWYQAKGSSYWGSAIYYATSPDGLTWTKYDNTQQAAGNTSSNGCLSNFTSGLMYGFAVIKDGSTYRAWYSMSIAWQESDINAYAATLESGTTATTSPAAGWHHLQAVKNTGTMGVFVDGVQVVAGTTSVQSISNSADVLIGGLFNGEIDEVKVFKSDILDTTGPTVASTTPADGATNIALNGDVTITWSENVDCSTVNTTNITSTSPGWTLASCGFNQAVFHASGQAFSTTYSVTVGTPVKDVAGNQMASGAAFSYTTPVLPAAPNFNQLWSSAPTSITSYFYDNSNNEDDFRLHDGSNTVMAIVPSTTQTQTGGSYSYTETNLSPNTQYTRHLHAHNAAGDGSAGSSLSNYTQAATPNVNALPRTAGTWYNTHGFTFANAAGWGQGGVQYYCYSWNQIAANSSWSTCTGSNSWSSGTLTQTAASTGSWYLHVLSYNANNYYGSFSSSQAVFGPYNYDITAPSAGSVNPANGALDVGRNSALSLTLSDANSGIDWSTFSITLAGSTSGTRTYTSADTSIVSKTGTSASYNVTVMPDYTFGSLEAVSVTVAVKDQAGNSLASSPSWSFTTADM